MKRLKKSDFKSFQIRSHFPPKYLVLNEQSFNYNTLPRNDRTSTGPDATLYKTEDNVKYKSVRKLSDYYLSTAWSQQTDNEEIKYEEEPTNFNI